MKLALIAALLALPLAAQVFVPPVPLPTPAYQGGNTIARDDHSVALPLAAQTPAPVEPSQIYGIGAGIQGLGPSQIQGGYFIGQHVGVGKYLIESTDLVRVKGGGVATAAHAGIYDRLAQLGPLSLGVIGDAGVAEGATGSASGSVSGWGLAGVKLWKWPLTLTGAARLMTIAGTGQVAQVRVYLTLEFK